MKTRNTLVLAAVLAVAVGGGAWTALRPAASTSDPGVAADAPVITEPAVEGRLVSGADVHMETAPAAAEAAAQVHGATLGCTDWEIWTTQPARRVWFGGCVGGPQKVHAHLGDGVFENEFAGRADLAPDRDYELRVRYRFDTAGGQTQWGAYGQRAFRTDARREPLPNGDRWVVRQPGYRVEEVADGFELPVHIAMVPKHSDDRAAPLAYVTELYGSIKVVTGDFKTHTYAKGLLNFDPSGKFPGKGETGVTGVVVEPQTGDVFAAILHESDGKHFPRVIRLHSTDGGLHAAKQTTVLDMPGESQEAAHQISQLTIGPDGKLYVHMGDGMTPETARNLDSFRGKILRLNPDGSAPEDNPYYDAKDGITSRDYVYALGFRNPFGGAWRPEGGYYEVENGTSIDRLAKVDKGVDYQWNGERESMRRPALYVWERSTAPTAIAFIDPQVNHGAGFPQDKYGHMFVAESGPTYALGPQELGKRIVEFTFGPDGSVSDPKPLIEYNGEGRSTVVGLAAGPDGLYFTALWPDAEKDDPTSAHAKVYRVRYTG
ncbi:PQQ-dependent sugar dehydrogenase [Catellatospora tritici]|uniref:PQQ-dependent sugar dehydrogenase n=1 Tax=Catellatospora tritici TaxID=2851566 RepID=UPI001C2D2949|nr:PQQ-dependent sugar dehydrogenase [Catellatospora tritici]MBV1854233.1 PQQ-dependent sugar dehydrogenase [Catellatospora tritici]